MKVLSFRLLAGILTALIGIAATSVFMFLSQLPDIEVDYNLDNAFFKKGEPKILTGEIEIKYAWSLIEGDSLTGKFKVTNKTNNTIYYTGYEKNSHWGDSWIKQDGEIRPTVIGLICVFGLERQGLLPNESAFFDIPVPQNKNPFEAGFLFKVGDEEKQKVAWVKVEKQLKLYGLNCKNKIVKTNSILAETCNSDVSK